MRKVLLLHGWTNRRPEGHWIRRTAAERRHRGNQFWYPQFPDPDTPDQLQWQDLLRQESNMMDEAPEGPTIVIAHSLGTTNWLFGALNDVYQKPFDRVLLVAPPDPEAVKQINGITTTPLELDTPNLAEQAKKWARELTVIAGDHVLWLPRRVGIYAERLRKTPPGTLALSN